LQGHLRGLAAQVEQGHQQAGQHDADGVEPPQVGTMMAAKPSPARC
jgi:hypothetical protein